MFFLLSILFGYSVVVIKDAIYSSSLISWPPLSCRCNVYWCWYNVFASGIVLIVAAATVIISYLSHSHSFG